MRTKFRRNTVKTKMGKKTERKPDDKKIKNGEDGGKTDDNNDDKGMAMARITRNRKEMTKFTRQLITRK